MDDALLFYDTTEKEMRTLFGVCRKYRAKRWDRINPKTVAEIDRYYADDPYLIPNLVDFNMNSAGTHFPNPEHFGKKVLDFGCGIGYTGEWLAHHGKEVTFADVKTRAFIYTQGRVENQAFEHAPRFIELHSGLLELTETYDAIFCIDVIEHIVNPIEMLWHFHEHLTKGGKLYITNLEAKHDDIHRQHLIYQPPQILDIMKLFGFTHEGGAVWVK